MNGGWGISYEISLRWIPLDLTDDKSTLAQVMAWCHQATNHYLSQCWPRSMLPNGVTRPQWVKLPVILVRLAITHQHACQQFNPGFSVPQYNNQSATKPKLAVKFFGCQQWWPFVQGLPELVANISSQFQHRVSAGFRLSCQMDTIKSRPHLKNETKFEWFIAWRLELAPSDCNWI